MFKQHSLLRSLNVDTGGNISRVGEIGTVVRVVCSSGRLIDRRLYKQFPKEHIIQYANFDSGYLICINHSVNRL